MKKLFVFLLGFGLLFSFVSASGCFHDAIHEVNKAGVITRGANVRNVACMYGSTKIATLAAGTKVRIIGQTAWTKIVMPDGKVGWVGNDFVSETNDWSNVPSPTVSVLNDYCDTTDLAHCPNPSPVGVEPTWYYRTVPNYTNPIPTPTPTPTPTPSSNLSPEMQGAVDSLVDTLMQKLDDKMGDDASAKKEFLDVLVTKISQTKVSYKVKPIMTYLVDKLEEQITLLYIDSLLDV